MPICVWTLKRAMVGLAMLCMVIFCLSAAAPEMRADVVASNFTPSDAFTSFYAVGGVSSGVTQALGVSFTVPNQNYAFEDAELVMNLQSGANVVDINLQTDSAGAPSGDILETLALTGALSSTPLTPAVLTFASATNPVLAALQTYWLIAYFPDASTSAGWVANIEGDSSTPTVNFVYNTADSPVGPWSAAPIGLPRSAFEIDGTPGAIIPPPPPPPPPVPEPSTWALFVTGLAAMALGFRKKMKTSRA